MKTLTRFACCALLLIAHIAFASDGSNFANRSASLQFGPPFRLYPSSTRQTETFITRNPINNNILFASANTIGPTGFISEGVYVSTDAGQTWTGNDTCTGGPVLGFHKGDPAIAIDRNGTFILVRLGFSPGAFSHWSTTNGRTWTNQKTISTDDQDRASVASDPLAASAFFGRTYATWVRLAPPYRIYYSYTDDGGLNWTVPASMNNPSQRGQGAEVSIGPNGRINICWAGVIPSSPYTEDFVGFATSTDGGSTWTVTENAYDMNGIQGTFTQKGNIRVNGLPKIDTDRTGGQRNGWIYIVTTQKNLAPAGSDPDVIIHRSTDNGQTWLPGVRVNQDPLNNGKYQYFPAIHVDDGGGVNVLYYDDRTTNIDSAGVAVSRSVDGGATWTDYRLVDRHFRPQPISSSFGQGYQGDNIGMTSVGNTLWPVWMDNSSGIYQIWTCPINLSSVSVDAIDQTIPALLKLNQNFPNPFNPATTIGFEVPSSGMPAGRHGFVSLKVFDVLGREVETLVHEDLKGGNYTRVFDGSRHPSGVYYYRLTTSAFSVTKSMVLMK
ncbi:MAG: T9SS type A sorting domain-containing protein [Ignavibacteriae bacterium]|nr:T9SS type A sorting domain-containing protein [Ignavibacteriota bacterium]